MREARYGHTCGIIVYNDILVAGGKSELGNLLSSVEILSLKSMEWRVSTPLPEAIHSMPSIEYGTTILVLADKVIYHYNEFSNSWMVEETQWGRSVAIQIKGKSLHALKIPSFAVKLWLCHSEES